MPSVGDGWYWMKQKEDIYSDWLPARVKDGQVSMFQGGMRHSVEAYVSAGWEFRPLVPMSDTGVT